MDAAHLLQTRANDHSSNTPPQCRRVRYGLPIHGDGGKAADNAGAPASIADPYPAALSARRPRSRAAECRESSLPPLPLLYPILPPICAAILQVYRMGHARGAVEVLVEDPAPAMAMCRLATDARNCIQRNLLPQPRRSIDCAVGSGLNHWGQQSALISRMREQLLLSHSAATAVFELAMLHQLRQNSDVYGGDQGEVEEEQVFKSYRLAVKGRLFKEDADLAALAVDTRKLALQERFEECFALYSAVVERVPWGGTQHQHQQEIRQKRGLGDDGDSSMENDKENNGSGKIHKTSGDSQLIWPQHPPPQPAHVLHVDKCGGAE